MDNPFQVNYGQVKTVAQFGADFNTTTSSTPIQDAIDSITDAADDKRYVVQINPGIYEENIVGKNYVELAGVGAGSEGTVVIQATSGTVYTAPNILSSIDNIVLELLPTASGGKLVDATAGGRHLFLRDVFKIASSTNGITAQVFDADCDSIQFLRSNMTYTMLGSSAGSNTHNIFNIDGSTELVMNTVDNRVIVNDIDDDINFMNFNSTGTLVMGNMFAVMAAINASYSGTMTGLKVTKNTDFKYPTQNFFTLVGAGSGTGYAIQVDTDTNDGVVTDAFNNYSITGFANNYYANTGTGDTINSLSNITSASDNITGTGTVNFINSQEYGQLQITGGGAFTIDDANQWHAFLGMSAGLSSDNVDVHTGLTGAITAFADAGGGQVTVTSAGHGIVDEGEYVSITGTTNYNGVFEITNITTDTFEITDTWVANDATGTFIYGDHIVVRRRGAYRLSWSFSASAVNANQTFDFAAFNGDTEITGTELQRKFASAGDIGVMASSPVVFLEKDDVLFFTVRNTTSGGDITISEGTFNINKIS